MADELAEAAAILFTRAADLEDNMGQIRACLRVRGGEGEGGEQRSGIRRPPPAQRGTCACCKPSVVIRSAIFCPPCILPPPGTPWVELVHMFLPAPLRRSLISCPPLSPLPVNAQERDIASLNELLGWYSYTRFSNPTGHYEFSLSTLVHKVGLSCMRGLCGVGLGKGRGGEVWGKK